MGRTAFYVTTNPPIQKDGAHLPMHAVLCLAFYVSVYLFTNFVVTLFLPSLRRRK